MKIPFSPPDIGEEEIENVIEALKSGWITTGPKTKRFEGELAKYIGTNRVACLNSATAAMELTLRLLGVGPGDEVIVPAYTYTATCSVVCHVGATPIIVDISKDSYEIDYDNLDSYITEKTKVIMPVDFAGKLCDYEKIFKLVKRNKSKFNPCNDIQKAFGRMIVLSDCAHGFGATKKGISAGNFADFTSFSFHAVKNLTTAEGGAITWKNVDGFEDDYIYKKFMELSLHGQTKDAFNKTKLGAWEYDIVSPAYKCNMTDIQAAIGLAQIKKYNGMLKKRQNIIKTYEDALMDLNVKALEHYGDDFTSSGHLFIVNVADINEEKRSQLISMFAERGIATNVHYKPLPMLTAYKEMGYDMQDYPNAYNKFKNEITFPLYSKLKEEEVEYIVEAFREIFEEFKHSAD